MRAAEHFVFTVGIRRYTVLATVLAMWVLKWLLHAARLALVGAHSG